MPGQGPYGRWEHDDLVFLAEASEALASCAHEAELRARAAELAVPFLAEGCFVALLTGLRSDAGSDHSSPERVVIPLECASDSAEALVLIAPCEDSAARGAVAEEFARRVALGLAAARRHDRAVCDLEELRRATQAEMDRRDEGFRRFMRSSPLGLAAVFGRDCSQVTINDALAEMLQLGSTVAEPLTPFAPEVLHGRFRRNGSPISDAELPWRLTAESGTEVRSVELDVIREDGRPVTLFGHASPLFDPQGNYAACLAAFVDVTSRKQAEAALAQADRNKDAFIAVLGHELRTPLGAMKNAARLLRRRSAGEPSRLSACDLLDRQLALAVRLVEDLQDISRIKRGRIDLHHAEVDLVELSRHAMEVMRPAAEKRGVELDASLPAVPLKARVDAARIEQVITNLLGNAIKYTNSGGQVWFSLERQDDWVRIAVRDTGVGIPPDLLTAAFDLYRQAEDGLSRSQGGLGLGLALVRGVVELHGGCVTARSEGLDRGSEFVAMIPLNPPAEPAGRGEVS